ncbi:endothelin-converting enzyme homolog isoform X2 [Nematostella vectensis]|uniref:endothelin-converting enzyme homolog isoform X2 n=2 Tax=Nematostella vectensis TaxID=45351 RepID=UPI00207781DC|nr:endothelin-converting enzyme homolog isoform X2 [Nematostella vectensis]
MVMDSTEDDAEDFNVKYKLRHYSKFKALVICCAVLLVLCVVFIVLFSLERGKTVVPSPPRCDSQACVFAAYNVIQQLNQSVDPCDNFYEYACGGWMDSNKLKAGETYKTGLSMVSEKNYALLKTAMEAAPENYNTNQAVMKTHKFYSSCIDTDAVNIRRDGALKMFIRDFGGWHVTPDTTGNVSSVPFLKRLAKMNRELVGEHGNQPLIGVSVNADPHNSNSYIIQLGTGKTGLERTYYLTNSSNSREIQQAYKQYMKDVAMLLGADSKTAQDMMMEVYHFEEKLATIEHDIFGGFTETELMSRAAEPGNLLFDLRMTIEELANYSNISVEPLLEYIQDVFQEQDFSVNKTDQILAYPPDYYKAVLLLYQNQTNTDPRVLDNYAMWSIIDDVISVLDSNYTNAYMAFMRSKVGNMTVKRWEQCLLKMQQTALRMPLGLLFVDKAFPKESRASIEDMSKYIRNSFIDSVDSLPWMDGATKEKAKEKAIAIHESIGYPDYIKDPAKLEAKIKNLTFGDRLFENTLSLIKFTVQTDLAQLKKPVNREKWELGPSQVNGYYNSRQNRIVFLAGILQPPFFNPLYPKYLNYGGLGMVIGHEITHGFDGSGRMFDKDGNLNNWWSSEASMNFNSKTQCLVHQYNTYSAFGKNLNGSQTLNENIADNGGIKMAYEGYKAWTRENSAEGALPGLGLSVDQLFYVGFARPWCSIYTEQTAILQINTDSHSYPKYRVIGPLQNDPLFSEVFQCKKNSKMNPAKKCAVW